jgi:hypothetical protein
MLGMPVTIRLSDVIIGTGAVAYPSWTIDWWRNRNRRPVLHPQREGRLMARAQRFSLFVLAPGFFRKTKGPLCTGSLT